MTPSPRRTVFAVLLAAALAAVPLASAASPALEAQRQLLLRERNPDAADRFLEDAALQSRLRAEDEKAALDLFRAAAELRDLRQLLRGYNSEDRVIREGLAARPACAFCQDPKQLLEWSDRFRASPRDFLRGALFEWDTLATPRAKWLAANGAPRAKWETMSFADREKKIREWGALEYNELMKIVPTTQAQLDALTARAEELNDALGHDEGYTLDQRVDRAAASVKGLAEAEKRLAKSGSPELQAALRAAKGAPDLETRLSHLGKIFDGLNIPDPVLHSAAPLKPGQGFDDTTRRLTAELLGPALMREIEGTWAGADLKAFYKTVPIKITVKPEGSGTMATYSDGVLNFGSGDIEDFLKARGRGARDLLTDPALFHDLVRELAPTFVHEATHHRQDVWANQKGINGAWSQYQEIEAMETESIYILEKIARDLSYKTYLAKSAQSSSNAREALSLANRLEKGGPDQFRRSIQALHYPGLLSLEGEVWSRIVKRNRTGAVIRAELARRDALPLWKRLLLKSGPALEEEYGSHAEFMTALGSAGTDKLRTYLEEEAARDNGEPKVYALHHARFEAVNRLTEERLRALQAEADPTKRKRPGVPAPGQRVP